MFAQSARFFEPKALCALKYIYAFLLTSVINYISYPLMKYLNRKVPNRGLRSNVCRRQIPVDAIFRLSLSLPRSLSLAHSSLFRTARRRQ